MRVEQPHSEGAGRGRREGGSLASNSDSLRIVRNGYDDDWICLVPKNGIIKLAVVGSLLAWPPCHSHALSGLGTSYRGRPTPRAVGCTEAHFSKLKQKRRRSSGTE